jgi:hypothetical protein
MARTCLLTAIVLAAGSAIVLYVVLANSGRSPRLEPSENPHVNTPADSDLLPSEPMPYRRLGAPREIADRRLPDDLRRFYAQNEGVGLDSDPQRIVRLCKLAEVRAVRWADLHILGKEKAGRGWEEFAGYRIGVSSFGDEIIYVLNAPVCAAGSIFTLGPDVQGPGGTGPLAIEPSLVLSGNFDEWLRNMDRAGWREYGLTPGDISELPKARKDRLLRYYKVLNPGIKWEGS